MLRFDNVRPFSRLLLLALALNTAACGATSRNESSVRARHAELPAVVNAQNYDDVERVFFKLALDDADRAQIRSQLVHTVVDALAPALERNDYAHVVERFERVMELYAPQDFDARTLSAELRPVALWLAEKGSARSDEGTVLGALRVLASLEATEQNSSRYQALAAWSADVRENIGSAVDRYEGWVRAWQEHARLSPATDVLDSLASLYARRRDAYAGMLSEQPMRGLLGGVSMQDFRTANYAAIRAPYDVAATYLLVGDLATAEARLRSLAPMNGTTEARLADMISIARRDEVSESRDAILTLARGFMQPDIGRPDVARALCRSGNRRFASDARFPQCMAEVAAIMGQAQSAAAYYREAISLSGDELRLYDEALTTIDALLRTTTESGPASEALAREGLSILASRTSRFPDAPVIVAGDRLELAVAVAALSGGRLEDAEQALEASLRTRENVEALLELGRLCSRTGRYDRAIELYRRALDLAPLQVPSRDDESLSGDSVNAQLQELLASAYFGAGNTTQGRRLSEQARTVWTQVATGRGGDLRFEAWMHVGILSGYLDQPSQAAEAFRRAATEGSGRHELYAKMLASLVVSSTPDLDLAYDTYRAALRQSSPNREWRVYFALWVKAVAARVRRPVDRELDEDLRRVAGGDGWAGQLARFGLGEIDGNALISAASTAGEQTEAQFYDGMRKLGSGDAEAARAALARVRASRLVTFFEYEMAEALESKIANTP